MNPYVVQLRLVCAALLLLGVAAFGQTPTPKPATPVPGAGGDVPNAKIAILDWAALAENVDELKVHYEKLMAEFSPRRTEIESIKASMDAKQEQLEKGTTLTAAQARKLQDDMEQLKKEGTRKMEDYQNDVAKREETLTRATYEKIQKFLFDYAAENKITLVLSASQVLEKGFLLYIDPKANITPGFVAAYNRANPVATAQKAPAPTAPKKP